MSDIILRNKDVEHIMLASCKYSFYGFGEKKPEKNFCLLALADIHNGKAQLASAVDYLNYYDAIDCGISLGDMQGANFAESDGSWYTSEVQRAQKPFYTVLGNHDLGNSERMDISATKQMAFDKFFAPVKKQIGIDGLSTAYYVKYFDNYKIALIVLDNYDVPDDLNENGDFAIPRGREAFSQKQFDWLIKPLAEIKSDYHVMIAMHDFRDRKKPLACAFTHEDVKADVRQEAVLYGNSHILPSIINAWINGEKLCAEYLPCEGIKLPILRINCDFSKRGKGNFICYLCGHLHCDVIAVDEKYENQHIVCLAPAAMDFSRNCHSDLPRAEGTKSEDLLTTVSVDTKTREIRLVRIGSNYTTGLKERSCFVKRY